MLLSGRSNSIEHRLEGDRSGPLHPLPGEPAPGVAHGGRSAGVTSARHTRVSEPVDVDPSFSASGHPGTFGPGRPSCSRQKLQP